MERYSALLVIRELQIKPQWYATTHSLGTAKWKTDKNLWEYEATVMLK